MHRLKSEVLDDLAHAVVEMEEGKAVEIALEAVECGIDPYVALEALSKAMEMVAKKYENGEYFIPELIVCSDTLYAALEILKPHLGSRSAKSLGRAVIGVVEGDIHDIGKNLVKVMLEFSGFDIHDLGRDVPLREFLDQSGKAGAHLICMSTLMTTS
ncbi:MAG TPA: B12-binding domain-containing protein, partial [Syntrophobacteraceae bacterium]|nr:B12-binding domain-containing protein [Syntrophobacteraceae bacterium]